MACQERASARPRGQGRLLTHTPERYPEGQQEAMGGRLVGPVRGALVPREYHIKPGLPSAAFTVIIRKHTGTRESATRRQ